MAKIEGLGSGLFTTAALFNHSCHPNIMRVNVGRRMVSAPRPTTGHWCLPGERGLQGHPRGGGGDRLLRAALVLRTQGKETTRHLQVRSGALSPVIMLLARFYKFSCRCVACEGAWPVQEMLGLTCPQGDLGREELAGLVAGVSGAMEALTLQLDWRGGIHLLREAQVLTPPSAPQC